MFRGVSAGNERQRMDNSLERKQIWAQTVEILFSCTDKFQIQALRVLPWKHWMTKNAKLRTLQSSRKEFAPPIYRLIPEWLFHSVRMNTPVIVWAAGKSFITPFEASTRNSQQWGLRTSSRISSLALAGEAKDLVSSNPVVRGGRIQTGCLWVTSAVPKIKE